jgi:hypothetical protein
MAQFTPRGVGGSIVYLHRLSLAVRTRTSFKLPAPDKIQNRRVRPETLL